jgi:hypoxanthine phosphoribosyltransferase
MPKVTRTLFSEEEIQAAVERIGAQISVDYANKKILMVTVLKGAFVFMADLLRQIKGDVEIDFMAVSSYGSEAKSSGMVRILKDINADVAGRDVLIVEDILDSGLTLKSLMKLIKSRGPASIAVATLLHKRGKQQTNIEPQYVGMDCPDEFVVGYGLDYNEQYRNLPYIGILDVDG